MPFTETLLVVAVGRKVRSEFFMALLFRTVVVVCRVGGLITDGRRKKGKIYVLVKIDLLVKID